MKIIFTILLCLMLISCTTRTPHGSCIGVFEKKDPKKVYELSIWNTFLSILLLETIIIPIVVVSNYTLCPEGNQ